MGKRGDGHDMAGLCSAARAGDMPALKAELAKGFDPNCPDFMGRLALGAAAAAGHEKALAALLAAGAKPDARDAEGKMALHHAVESGSGCAAQLIKLLPQVDARCSVGRSTPLHLALRGAPLDDAGAASRVAELMEAGADPDARDAKDRTALGLACENGLRECCKELFDFGADPNGANPRTGETPLMVAAKLGQAGCVEELLMEGADVLALDRDGFSALRHAAAAGVARTCEQLMGAGARHGEKCIQGKTPVDAARERGHSDLADWLACAKMAVEERAQIRGVSARPGFEESVAEPEAAPRARSKSRL